MFMALLLVPNILLLVLFIYQRTRVEHDFAVLHQRSKHEVKTGTFGSISGESKFEMTP